MADPKAPPVAVREEEHLITGGRAAVLVGALILGVMSFQLNSSMLTPALPDIARSFGVARGM